MSAKVVSLTEVKRNKIIAQYIAYYGNTHDSERKATQLVARQPESTKIIVK
jgi:hypothetical protein